MASVIMGRIKKSISPGLVIPKPEGRADFVVKNWGIRRGEPALIYLIPNHQNPSKPYQKGITESEFDRSFAELQKCGELTRAWFDRSLHKCAKEGGCNFTTIGGIFELLGVARYANRGTYQRCHK